IFFKSSSNHRELHSFPTRRSSDLGNHTFTHPLLTVKSKKRICEEITKCRAVLTDAVGEHSNLFRPPWGGRRPSVFRLVRQLGLRSEEHTSELQSQSNLVCRLLLEK